MSWWARPSFRRPYLAFRQPRHFGRAGGVLSLGIARQHRAEVELRIAALIRERAMLDQAEMMFHHGAGSLRVAPAQGREDLAMLLDGTVGGMRPAIERQDQRTARHHLTEITSQQPVARKIRELDVEFTGEPAGHPYVVALAGGFFFPDVAFEFGAEVRRPSLDHQPDDVAFEQTPN